jgi:hypothetical protein
MGFFCLPTSLQWWLFCSPNLRVVELWSLSELDSVRLVFFLCCLVLLLLVQTEGSRLWPVGMADVDGLRWSYALMLDL